MITKTQNVVCHKDTKTQRKYINKTWRLSDLVASRKGMTLTEMAVVIGIIAVMVGLTLPVANVLYNSFESTGGAKSMLNAALSSAKSIAIKEHRYAGIRFQKRYDPASVLNASQYMIFIIQDPNISAYGFKAVEGIQTVKLPDSIGVMDLIIVTNHNVNNPINPGPQTHIDIAGNIAIDSDIELTDTTAFSIIFSPSGKLVIHGVRTRNRNGCPIWVGPGIILDNSQDDIFNTLSRITDSVNPTGMFLQDDYFATSSNPDYGLGPEPSRNSFYIYETKKLKQVPYNNRFDGYLKTLKPVYISPYTGTIIDEK